MGQLHPIHLFDCCPSCAAPKLCSLERKMFFSKTNIHSLVTLWLDTTSLSNECITPTLVNSLTCLSNCVEVVHEMHRKFLSGWLLSLNPKGVRVKPSFLRWRLMNHYPQMLQVMLFYSYKAKPAVTTVRTPETSSGNKALTLRCYYNGKREDTLRYKI